MRFEPPQPTDSLRRRRRRLLPFVLLAFAALIILVASVSAYNYFDISILTSHPSSAATHTETVAPPFTAPPSGEIVWSYDAGETIAVPPVAQGNSVFITAGLQSESGRVVALDAATGQPRWIYRLHGVSDYPVTVAGDLLYTSTRDGRLIVLNHRTGKETWSYKTEDILHGSPAVQNGRLFLASGQIHALDALTGRSLWTHEPEGGKAIGPVANSEGIVAVLSAGNHLNLINSVKGKRRLTKRLWFGGIGTPVILGDKVYLSGDRGSVQAVELQARDIAMEKALRFWWTKLWLYKAAPRPPDPVGYAWHHRGIGGISARIVAHDESKLFLVARHPDHSATVVAMQAQSGEVLWRFNSGTIIAGGVVGVGETLVFCTQAGEMYALDAASGEIVWQLDLGFPVNAIKVISSDSLIVTSQSGRLHLVR
ncbi:MAG: PQQ-binding-like beta-propeller repeat protein [Chloroflexota bacterium]|nr:PQQ-binding-like beta-propeller repeat protein [Chloroflexota bacterium]